MSIRAIPRRHLLPLLTVVAATTLVALPADAQRHRMRTFGDTAAWLEECRDDWNRGDDGRERHCEARTTTVRATGGRIMIDAGQNGGVAVRGGEGDEIRVIAKLVATAPTADEAAEIARGVKVNVSPTSIGSDGPMNRSRRQWHVSYDIIVPRGADVSIETHNGPISMEGLNGRVEARAVNGPLDIREMGGDVSGRTTNGPLNAELSGTKWVGRGLNLQTTNGPVNLYIPAGYNARLETGTVNGPMRFDFPVTVQGRITRRLSTDIGSGGPTIRAVTTNGPVVVRRM